ncbi:trypsin-like serine peptidase [Paenibacillus arenosi]|uniref:Serine protease n=1 Tax=Paenibacillus arenosi TaxID=2774142 RepID=A0ABR9AW79_9BACL|nr:serine protease [Paenibacillus arenosi]MBD8497948.1 trypsin-like peptidase domain-containing protein [Paenibacillus arenosi]
MSDTKKFKLTFSNEEMVKELRRRANLTEEEGVAAPAAEESTSLNVVPTDEIVRALQDNREAIYGLDNRKDLYEITNQQLVQQANAVVALFEAGNVMDNGDGTSSLQTISYGESNELCENERFFNQPVGAFCSGFLVTPQMIATAGHCITDTALSNIRVVFGFRMKNETEAITRISNDDIYRVDSVIGQELTGGAADWALLKLERPVDNHRPMAIRREGKIASNTALHLIGHPSGLPLKVAADAKVIRNDKPTHFTATLDAFQGNSGSPVFNSVTNEVEGILVRGEVDFVPTGSCNIANICTSSCDGEDCTRTTEFAEHVPLP